MPEGIDEAARAFATEIAPDSQPRDQAGRFVERTNSPESMFSPREVEGGADAGDNPKLRSREQDVADGREPQRRTVETAETVETGDLDEDERRAAVPDEEPEEQAADDSQKFEVMVDGQPVEVSLNEALAGYVRQETFHRRMQEVAQTQAVLGEEAARQQQNWAVLIKARSDYEEDLRGLIPKEPNWDQEFARDPNGAHQQQKIFSAIYGQLAQSRAQREQMAAQAQEEADRRLKQYAVDGFSRFVMDAKIPDEATLKKELKSMRQTAFSAGFSETEVATVYDPRMLKILRKASKYDRMMAAARPKAVVPGKGKTLTPGAATPFGNGPRKSIDDAQRRLASSGRLDDAAEVFRRML